jgi:signal transduction histidine kinase
LWMVKESILGTFHLRSRDWQKRNVLWFLSSLFLTVVPFTEFFIPSTSTHTMRQYGIGYYMYNGSIAALYAKLLFDSLRVIKRLSGASKIELQLWLLGGTVIAVLIYLFIWLWGLTFDPIYRTLQPIAVLVFYAGTAFSITSNRLFDARQILLVGAEKIALIGASALISFFVTSFFVTILSTNTTLVITTAVVVLFSGKASAWLDRKFQFVSHAGTARREAFATAQRERRAEALESSFIQLLKGWGQTENAVIISGSAAPVSVSKSPFSGGGVELDADSVEIETLRALRWATPERLSRERASPERAALAQFLNRHGLGVLLIEEGASMAIIIGVGIAASRRPYTYPEVTQLMELGSIIQGALERAHFSAKAQHAEQLATVGVLGASVAHEIRNPLVSIKTFVQLLPTHYQDPLFRDKFFKLIGDEVARIDQLTEQLLDLSSPRAYSAQPIELHALLNAGLDLVSAKAAHRQVQLITDFNAQPDRAFTDASAAKQVILNLCFNAIQAVEAHCGDERWIKISTRNIERGIEMAVADSGPGISPDIFPRLFQPFQTTKSSGFGLGLATCSDILSHLHATIKVDPPEPGRGAIFRVTFPCQPL